MAVVAALDVYASAELHSAAMNMAIDQALLEVARVPSLRFYGWRQPSISFGYFGRYADVADEQPHRDIVRRWTGGGIVFHGDDLTYALVLPADVASGFRSSRVVYAQVHGAINRALGSGISAALATSAAPKISDACFANPVEYDVVLNGRKIAGAAQRRTRVGLLHQGSIQCDTLCRSFQDEFAHALCPSFDGKELPSDLLARAAQIAHERYATRDWLHRR